MRKRVIFGWRSSSAEGRARSCNQYIQPGFVTPVENCPSCTSEINRAISQSLNNEPEFNYRRHGIPVLKVRALSNVENAPVREIAEKLSDQATAEKLKCAPL